MNKNFTVTDTRTIEEMLDDYQQQKEKYQELLSVHDNAPDYQALDNIEKNVYDNYFKSHHFLEETCYALDFAQNSTLVLTSTDRDSNLVTRCSSLMNDPIEYAQTVVTLTGGFNENMMSILDDIRPEILKTNLMTDAEHSASIDAALSVPVVSMAIKDEIGAGDVLKTKSVSDMVTVIRNTLEYRTEYDISDINITNDTLKSYFEAEKSNLLHDFSIEREKIKEFTAVETTIDPALVNDKTKLEEVRDIGTIERKQGVLDYEQKEEIREEKEEIIKEDTMETAKKDYKKAEDKIKYTEKPASASKEDKSNSDNKTDSKTAKIKNTDMER